jgi:hypothetical protein
MRGLFTRGLFTWCFGVVHAKTGQVDTMHEPTATIMITDPAATAYARRLGKRSIVRRRLLPPSDQRTVFYAHAGLSSLSGLPVEQFRVMTDASSSSSTVRRTEQVPRVLDVLPADQVNLGAAPTRAQAIEVRALSSTGLVC